MSRWERFCVVGIGGHARTKLIPAIEANGQRVAGLVSRQPPEALPEAPVFARIEDALAALPAETVFVIASPPALHFDQVSRVLTAGRDVIVEKPAFLRAAEAVAVAEQCHAQGRVLVEGFMHRHTGLYARLIEAWRLDRARIAGLEADFLIPAMPPGTFRQTGEDAATILWDMGCYVVALLQDLGLPLDALTLIEHGEAMLTLGAERDGVAVRVRLGIAPYCNAVVLRSHDGTARRFGPFFYGRSGEKRIETSGLAGAATESIVDCNAFEAMFALPREHWLETQPNRLEAIVAVTAALERLAVQFAA